jgi:SAM-dependent methyltransferase
MRDYDPNWIRRYFDEYGMKEWGRWDASPVERVKWFLHLHYLREHVVPGDRVLEVGAGAGRFTQELARITSPIVVSDISPGQLELNRSNARRLGYASEIEEWVECDMCALEELLPEHAFDATVCYGGPLSYVFDRRDAALEQLIRVTRPGGKLLLSVMSLWGGVHQYLEGVLQTSLEANREVIATGDLAPDVVGSGHHYCHMFRAEELRHFLEVHGLEVLVISASDSLSTHHADFLGEVDECSPQWDLLMEMEAEASRSAGACNMGSHIIAVCKTSRA